MQRLHTLFRNGKCVREQLLNYFGETFIEKPAQCCPVCELDLQQVLLPRGQVKEEKVLPNWNTRLNELLH